MKALTGIFLHDWRNKLVALFFASSIWFVAYESEKRPLPTYLTVEFVPEDPSERVVVDLVAELEDGSTESFSDRVEVTFSGPRKEIDLLPQRLQRNRRLPIGKGVERYEFDEEDFGFPRDGVSIVKFDPPVVTVKQEPVEEVVIQNLREQVRIEPFPTGAEIYKEVLEPESGSVRLRCPASLRDTVSVSITVRSLRGATRASEPSVPLEIVSSDPDLVRRTVQIWDWSVGEWVPATTPPQVRVRVRIEEKEEVWQNPAVNVEFRVPPTSEAFRIVLHEVQGGKIPLRFIGPGTSIEGLRSRFRSEPSFAVSVPVPDFDPARGGTFTFSESDLELYGFPDIRVDQHLERREDLKSAWSYDVVVEPREGERDG